MRDRPIELLEKAAKEMDCPQMDEVADYLIANGVCIKCTECHARSKFFPCDCNYLFSHGEKNVFISKERATKDAINHWNRRADK